MAENVNVNVNADVNVNENLDRKNITFSPTYQLIKIVVKET